MSTRFDSIGGFRNRFDRFDLRLDSIGTRFFVSLGTSVALSARALPVSEQPLALRPQHCAPGTAMERPNRLTRNDEVDPIFCCGLCGVRPYADEEGTVRTLDPADATPSPQALNWVSHKVCGNCGDVMDVCYRFDLGPGGTHSDCAGDRPSHAAPARTRTGAQARARAHPQAYGPRAPRSHHLARWTVMQHSERQPCHTESFLLAL